MKPFTLEWVEKAEGDFHTMLREYRARKRPNYDAACFHAQQCVEKYLKASLQERDIPFTKIHDLVVLLDMLLPFEPSWDAFRPGFRELTVWAVVYRYPGETAGKESARKAVKICRAFRKTARQHLGLPPE